MVKPAGFRYSPIVEKGKATTPMWRIDENVRCVCVSMFNRQCPGICSESIMQACVNVSNNQAIENHDLIIVVSYRLKIDCCIFKDLQHKSVSRLRCHLRSHNVCAVSSSASIGAEQRGQKFHEIS